MNKRIKELAEQAGFMEAWFSESGDDCEREIKKFAELIVKGCCDWIDGSPTTDAGQLLLSKSFIIACLKGHFGIK